MASGLFWFDMMRFLALPKHCYSSILYRIK